MTGLLVTFIISFILGSVGFFTGGDFLRWFFISLFVQFGIFFIINLITKTYAQIQINRLEVERLNAIEKNTARIKCVVCGEINEVVIDINAPNEFRCKKCSSLNSVHVQISNAQKTEINDVNGVFTEDSIRELAKLDADERG